MQFTTLNAPDFKAQFRIYSVCKMEKGVLILSPSTWDREYNIIGLRAHNYYLLSARNGAESKQNGLMQKSLIVHVDGLVQP